MLVYDVFTISRKNVNRVLIQTVSAILHQNPLAFREDAYHVHLLLTVSSIYFAFHKKTFTKNS